MILSLRTTAHSFKPFESANESNHQNASTNSIQFIWLLETGMFNWNLWLNGIGFKTSDKLRWIKLHTLERRLRFLYARSINENEMEKQRERKKHSDSQCTFNHLQVVRQTVLGQNWQTSCTALLLIWYEIFGCRTANMCTFMQCFVCSFQTWQISFRWCNLQSMQSMRNRHFQILKMKTKMKNVT